MNLLKIKNLNAFYGAAQVLWGVNLEIGENEIVALIGTNGAGKTTLMHTISGLIQKKEGDIMFEGETVFHKNSAQIVEMGIAQVPEGRRLFAGMTVVDNLLMGAYLRKDKKAIGEDVERVYRYFPRLAERKNQLTGKMSGGEQQMCAIGRALMSKPKVILIDELSLGLAPIVVDELIEILNCLKKEGISILLVEQDVQTGLDVAQRAYVLEHGRVVLEGSTAELQSNVKIKESYLGI